MEEVGVHHLKKEKKIRKHMLSELLVLDRIVAKPSELEEFAAFLCNSF